MSTATPPNSTGVPLWSTMGNLLTSACRTSPFRTNCSTVCKGALASRTFLSFSSYCTAISSDHNSRAVFSFQSNPWRRDSSKSRLTYRCRPSASLIHAKPCKLSMKDANRPSLILRASSACLRFVMSIIAPKVRVGRRSGPSLSKNVHERKLTHLTLPSSRNTRCSTEKRSSQAGSWACLMAWTAVSRSSGWSNCIYPSIEAGSSGPTP